MSNQLHILLAPPRSGLNLLSRCLTLLGCPALDANSPINAETITNLLLQDLGLPPSTPALPRNWVTSDAASKASARIHKLLSVAPNNPDATQEDTSPFSFTPYHLPIANPLLADLWLQAAHDLGFSLHCVVLLRHPYELALSLRENTGLDLQGSMILWLAHTRAALRAVEGYEHTLVTYDQLLADPISTCTKIFNSLLTSDLRPLTSALLDHVQPGQKHHHASSFTEHNIYKPYADIYNQLRTRQHSSPAKQDTTLFDPRTADQSGFVKICPPRETGDPTGVFHRGKDSPAPPAGLNQAQPDCEAKFNLVNRHEVSSPQAIQPGWKNNSSDLIDTLLQALSQTAPHVPLTQSASTTNQLTTRITFPSLKHESGTTHTIPLLEDQWQKITLPVPEPEALKDTPIQIMPLNTNGIVMISQMNLVNQANETTVWSLEKIALNNELSVSGTAIVLPGKEKFLALVTGDNPSISFRCNANAGNNPHNFNLWIKTSREQHAIHSFMAPALQDESASLLAQPIQNFTYLNGLKIPQDEEAIIEYTVKERSKLNDRKIFQIYMEIARHHVITKNFIRAIHFFEKTLKLCKLTPNEYLRLGQFYLTVNRPDYAYEYYTRGFVEKFFYDERLKKRMRIQLDNFKKATENARKVREHGHRMLMDYLADNLEYIKAKAQRKLCLIEVGSTREEHPDQGSTAKLANFCHEHDLDFITVDMDPHNTMLARDELSKIDDSFQAINQKGEDFFKEYTGHIDFVFLDAYDCDHGKHSDQRQEKYQKYIGEKISNEASYRMHLNCVKEIRKKISPWGVICIDDTFFKEDTWHGKGGYAVPYLLNKNYCVVKTCNNGVLLTIRSTRNIENLFLQQEKANNSDDESFKLPLIVCAHHKAGASFTIKTFREIARKFKKELWFKFYDLQEPKNGWDICIHQHARIHDIILNNNFLGWRSIRNPKSLIYSATIYHQKCAEQWVDVPLQQFTSDTFYSVSTTELHNIVKDKKTNIEKKIQIMNGKYEKKYFFNIIGYESPYNMYGATYREYLQSLHSIEEKLIFEMNSYSRGVIHDMINFPNDNRFYTITLENISKQKSMSRLKDSFLHLGFTSEDTEECLKIAKKNCLWNIGIEKISNHATTGMSNEWEKYFTGRVEKEYRKLFGWVENALGYEH